MAVAKGRSSGRAGGGGRRPAGEQAEPQDLLTKLARAHTRPAFQAIADALKDDNARIRIAAGELILAYGHGKPPSRIEGDGNDLGALIREAWARGDRGEGGDA
jgi:hypothetical protein